jgi:tripartite-type tricarboxylate transporter receptor subunit TctC
MFPDSIDGDACAPHSFCGPKQPADNNHRSGRLTMIKYRSVLRAACLTLSVCGLAASVHADDFYKGKTITITVGSASGGGYDTYARFLARHWPKYIAGHPNVVVENMPGAGSLKATNYIYNVAPKDGTTVGAVQQGILFEPLFKTMGSGKEAKFDPTKLGWVGAATHDTAIMVVWHSTPFKSLADIKDAQVLTGSAGATTNYAVYPRLMNATLGTNIKIVEGYQGTSGVTLALERGEIQAVTGWDYSSLMGTKADWVKNHEVRILVQFGAHKLAALSDVPLARDQATTPLNQKVLDLITLRQEIGRPYIAPPGLPAERLATLSGSFQKMTHDAAFLEDARKHQIEIDPSTADECRAVIQAGYAAPADVVKKARAILIAKKKS